VVKNSSKKRVRTADERSRVSTVSHSTACHLTAIRVSGAFEFTMRRGIQCRPPQPVVRPVPLMMGVVAGRHARAAATIVPLFLPRLISSPSCRISNGSFHFPARFNALATTECGRHNTHESLRSATQNFLSYTVGIARENSSCGEFVIGVCSGIHPLSPVYGGGGRRGLASSIRPASL